MHVGIARKPAEIDLFPEIHQVQSRDRGELHDRLGDLLVRTLVLVLGQALGELAHIFHRQLASCIRAVDTTGDVAQLAVRKADQAVRHGTDLGYLRQVHGQVFQFGKAGEKLRLWLEDIAPPQAHDRKAGRTFVDFFEVERELGLNAGYGGLAADYLFGQFGDICACIRQRRRRRCAEHLARTGRMEVGLSFFQFLITIEASMHGFPCFRGVRH